MSGLQLYLAGGGEAALQGAYELGRRTIANGLGALEMLAIHQQCVALVCRDARTAQEVARIVEQSSDFLAESLSSIEMALRGFRETNARLSRNVEELRSAHQALEAEQRRYRDLFDSAPDGYLVTDLEGVIEEANLAAETLLGVSSESLNGTRLLRWVAEDEHAAFESRLKQLLREDADRSRDWEFHLQPQYGVCFPATLGVRVVRTSTGHPASLRLLLRDVTERKRIEEERAQMVLRERVAQTQWEAAQRSAFLAEVSALLVASLDSEAAMRNVAKKLVPYLGDSCLVYLVEGENRIRLLCCARTDRVCEDRGGRFSQEPIVIPPQSLIHCVLAKGEVEVFSPLSQGTRETHPGEIPELAGFFEEEGLASAMLTPIQIHGRAQGLIVLGAAQPDYYDRDLVVLAGDLAHRCALALDNAQLYRAMAAERDKASEANRAKDEFLGILGHELRNPLVPILGWARNLRKNRAILEDKTLSQGVGAIERNSLNILRLADDCLDLVRISERKVALERNLVDLNEIVRGSLDALRQVAVEKGLEIGSRLWPSSLWVMGDRTRLEQVMNNLLMNAMKYTASGGGISVSSTNIDDAVEIEIKDTGIGIAPEFLEQVFQPFRRGNWEWSTPDASLGLGLAIARKIVELHGGTIWAESPGLGGGSTFHVRLSAAQAVIAAPHSSETSRERRAEANPLRILLVDDQQDITDLIKIELESLGYSVMTAPDGQRGFDAAMRCFPDVIISDLKLPVIDGFELIRKIRAIPSMDSIPVIALTGLGTKKHLEAAMAAGFDAHLNKPAEISDLSDLVQALTAQRRTAL